MVIYKNIYKYDIVLNHIDKFNLFISENEEKFMIKNLTINSIERDNIKMLFPNNGLVTLKSTDNSKVGFSLLNNNNNNITGYKVIFTYPYLDITNHNDDVLLRINDDTKKVIFNRICNFIDNIYIYNNKDNLPYEITTQLQIETLFDNRFRTLYNSFIKIENTVDDENSESHLSMYEGSQRTTPSILQYGSCMYQKSDVYFSYGTIHNYNIKDVFKIYNDNGYIDIPHWINISTDISNEPGNKLPLFINNNNEVCVSGSSIKYKTNIIDLEDNEVEFLNNIELKSFDFKKILNCLDENDDITSVEYIDVPHNHSYGFIAETLDEIIPNIDIKKNLLVYNKNNDLSGINYYNFIPFIIKDNQLIKQKLDYLELEIDSILN